eukprot:COSAG06_NODE_2320_length_7089_cov_5.139628_2_plen_78_part_00
MFLTARWMALGNLVAPLGAIKDESVHHRVMLQSVNYPVMTTKRTSASRFLRLRWSRAWLGKTGAVFFCVAVQTRALK